MWLCAAVIRGRDIIGPTVIMMRSPLLQMLDDVLMLLDETVSLSYKNITIPRLIHFI